MFTECKYARQPNYLKGYFPIDDTGRKLMVIISWRKLRKAEYVITATAVVTTFHNGVYSYIPANSVCVKVSDDVYNRRTVKSLWNVVPIVESEDVFNTLKDNAIRKESGNI